MAMQHRRAPSVAVVLAVAALAIGAASARAQGVAPQSPAPADVEADPIRCWWRTSTGAIRVGEPFSLVLTCALVENESTTVVADRSRLEASAMQLPPFEVVGGQRGPDLVRGQRRFFQYQYSLRLINENMFGADVKIPGTQITYHIDSRVAGGETVRGRDQTYGLPSESVRVLSLVPADARDIRDPSYVTFSAIDAQRFRARGWFVAGGVLYASAGLVIVVALVQLARRHRASDVRRALLAEGEIVRGVARELQAVERAAQQDGWTRELAARAAGAARVAATLALGRRLGQAAAPAESSAHDGQLFMRGGWLRGKRVVVSGAATAGALERELASGHGSMAHRTALEQLQTALARFTAAEFGRDEAMDAAALAEALADVRRALARVRLESRWVMKKMRRMSYAATELGNRAWSR